MTAEVLGSLLVPSKTIKSSKHLNAQRQTSNRIGRRNDDKKQRDNIDLQHVYICAQARSMHLPIREGKVEEFAKRSRSEMRGVGNGGGEGGRGGGRRRGGAGFTWPPLDLAMSPPSYVSRSSGEESSLDQTRFLALCC